VIAGRSAGGAGAAGGGSPWRRELGIALAIGGGLWLLTLIPYLVGYLDAPPGKSFNGFFYLADDATTYVSKMREGAEGAWGWSDRYISVPVARPVLLFLFYVLWGKVAALLHISLYAAYHLARLSGAVALVAAARALARRTLPDPSTRRLALALALLGSGAGYLAALAHYPSILGQPVEALDLHLPELSGLYSVMAIPHFAWSAALMAWSLLALMDLAAGATPARVARAALLMAALGLIHPQMLFVLAVLAAAHLALARAGRGAWVGAGVAFAANVPLLVYYLQALTGDPVIVAWSRQWKHQAPGAVGLALALGLPLALAVFGALRGAGRAAPAQRLMAVWVVLVAALLYLPNPVNIQRRLLDGIYLPIAVLAAAGVAELARRRGGDGRSLRFGVVAVASVSSLLVVGIGLLWAVGHAPFIYLDRDAETVMVGMALDPHSACLPPAVLAHPDTGLWVPARTGYRVVVGHYSETISYPERAHAALAAMRRGGPDLAAFMAANQADLLWIGPTERDAGAAPPDPGLFAVAYSAGDVSVYRLRQPASTPTTAPASSLAPPCGLAPEPVPGG
jgi:hypothetical protein